VTSAGAQLWVSTSESGLEAGASDVDTITFEHWNVDTLHVTTAIIQTQYTGALTDGAPTAAQITSAVGLSPSVAGAGFSCTIRDTNGTGLLYRAESDGTYWFYTAMIKAI
jgi:hypothetical protein